MIDLAAVIGALALLIYFAFRGITVILLAPVMALLAVFLTGGLPILASYTQIFMVSTGGFIVSFFPLFMLGAIFGKLMDDSGSAASIAQGVSRRLGPQRAIISVVLCCGLLTYGGVSAFVVAFAIYPVAAALFQTADIPKRLIPGTLALGAFTFTMTALPGTPSIQNAIPMPFFGTTVFAAPVLGTIAAAVMLVLGILWLERRARKARTAGEGYGSYDDSVPKADVVMREHSQGKGFDIIELQEEECHRASYPSVALAVLPVIVVIVTNYVFLKLIVPQMDTSFLEQPRFGATTIESVRGLWAVIVALFSAILVLISSNWNRLTDLRASLDKGTDASVLPIFNTASLVGFGAVVAALPVFDLLSKALLSIAGGNPLTSVALSVTALSAITGSASGGMSIALDVLGSIYVELAQDAGVSLAAMHRITSVASGALDALPHNGAVITLLSVCGLSHRESYLDIAVVAVAFPLVALLTILLLASIFGTF